jgi:hypothetical protein
MGSPCLSTRQFGQFAHLDLIVGFAEREPQKDLEAHGAHIAPLH